MAPPKAAGDELLKTRMSRRDLFIRTAKAAIPTLGILGLTLTGLSGEARAAKVNVPCTTMERAKAAAKPLAGIPARSSAGAVACKAASDSALPHAASALGAIGGRDELPMTKFYEGRHTYGGKRTYPGCADRENEPA